MNRLFSVIALLCAFCANADDWKWYDPMECGFPVVQNQGWTSEIGNTYYRLPERAINNVRGPVWNLSRHSAGLAIHFYSNAPQIKVRYVVEGPLAMHHMPATGASGLDLYGIDMNGKSHRFFGFFNGYPDADTINTRFVNDRMNEFHSHGYEFHLYLPLYNGVKKLEIAVPDSCELSFIPVSPEKPIVLYGTSIEQGGVASRPGMAWPNIVQRSLDYPLINLGFSGNGRLEQGVLDLMGEVDARLYILACLANLTDKQPAELDSLITSTVSFLRTKNDAPIILVEHPGFSDAPVNSTQAEIIERLNTSAKTIYGKLKNQGVENLYYVSREDMNIPAEGWVDDVHPSDLGMVAMASAIEERAREALKIPLGNLSTTIPVTQRREPDNYEWRQRHRDVIARNISEHPKTVVIGNSIVHYWGGTPEAKIKNGEKTWKKYFGKASVGNMGFGWDRIENALWRVYHGELDGFDAERVILMIGTNNYGMNSDEEIVEGLKFLISAVRERQPSAEIVVTGILPRRNAVDWTKSLNEKIADLADSEGCTFINPGLKLISSDGKLDESLFTDGLHPNEKGYELIAPALQIKR